MPHTKIPDDELKVFGSLTDVKVVFDVGARDDVDYLIINPNIELHAFEPNPVFFKELSENVGNRPNVHLNNWGAGDVEGRFSYNDSSQSIGTADDGGVVVKRLDTYIAEKNIENIDFLKVDTEGYDWKVIQGLGEKIKICRYIQYEKNMNPDDGEIERTLRENGFTTYYTGYRNQIAVHDGEQMPWIPTEIHEGGTGDKDQSNYL